MAEAGDQDDRRPYKEEPEEERAKEEPGYVLMNEQGRREAVVANGLWPRS